MSSDSDEGIFDPQQYLEIDRTITRSQSRCGKETKSNVPLRSRKSNETSKNSKHSGESLKLRQLKRHSPSSKKANNVDRRMDKISLKCKPMSVRLTRFSEGTRVRLPKESAKRRNLSNSPHKFQNRTTRSNPGNKIHNQSITPTKLRQLKITDVFKFTAKSQEFDDQITMNKVCENSVNTSNIPPIVPSTSHQNVFSNDIVDLDNALHRDEDKGPAELPKHNGVRKRKLPCPKKSNGIIPEKRTRSSGIGESSDKRVAARCCVIRKSSKSWENKPYLTNDQSIVIKKVKVCLLRLEDQKHEIESPKQLECITPVKDLSSGTLTQETPNLIDSVINPSRSSSPVLRRTRRSFVKRHESSIEIEQSEVKSCKESINKNSKTVEVFLIKLETIVPPSENTYRASEIERLTQKYLDFLIYSNSSSDQHNCNNGIFSSNVESSINDLSNLIDENLENVETEKTSASVKNHPFSRNFTFAKNLAHHAIQMEKNFQKKKILEVIDVPKIDDTVGSQPWKPAIIKWRNAFCVPKRTSMKNSSHQRNLNVSKTVAKSKNKKKVTNSALPPDENFRTMTESSMDKSNSSTTPMEDFNSPSTPIRLTSKDDPVSNEILRPLNLAVNPSSTSHTNYSTPDKSISPSRNASPSKSLRVSILDLSPTKKSPKSSRINLMDSAQSKSLQESIPRTLVPDIRTPTISNTTVGTNLASISNQTMSTLAYLAASLKDLNRTYGASKCIHKKSSKPLKKQNGEISKRTGEGIDNDNPRRTETIVTDESVMSEESSKSTASTVHDSTDDLLSNDDPPLKRCLRSNENDSIVIAPHETTPKKQTRQKNDKSPRDVKNDKKTTPTSAKRARRSPTTPEAKGNTNSKKKPPETIDNEGNSNEKDKDKKIDKSSKKIKVKRSMKPQTLNNNCSVCETCFDTTEALAAHIYTHSEDELQQAYKIAKQKIENNAARSNVPVQSGNETINETINETSNETTNVENGDIISPPSTSSYVPAAHLESCDESIREDREETQSTKEEQTTLSVIHTTNEVSIDEPVLPLNDNTVISKEVVEFSHSTIKSITICPCHSNDGGDDHNLRIEMTLLCRVCKVLFRRIECFETHYRQANKTLCGKDRLKGRLPKLFCSGCRMILDNEMDLPSHLRIHTRDNPELTVRFFCNICKVVFTGISGLFFSHWALHLKNPLFLASRLSFPRNSIVSDRDAKNDHFLVVAEYICGTCKITFNLPSELENHRCGKSNETCLVISTNITNVTKALNTTTNVASATQATNTTTNVENVTKATNTADVRKAKNVQKVQNFQKILPMPNLRFICDPCEKKFVNKVEFDQHIDEVNHTTPRKPEYRYFDTLTGKTYTCQECGQSFKTFKKFEDHWTKHSISHPIYECVKCKDEFDDVDKFMQHIKPERLSCYVHDDVLVCKVSYAESSIICNFCSLGFANRHQLIEHYKRDHANQKLPWIPISSVNRSAKQTEVSVIVQNTTIPSRIVSPSKDPTRVDETVSSTKSTSNQSTATTGEEKTREIDVINIDDSPDEVKTSDSQENEKVTDLNSTKKLIEEIVIDVETLPPVEYTNSKDPSKSNDNLDVQSDSSQCKGFLRVKNLADLMQQKTINYPCRLCTSKFDSESNLKKHTAAHAKKSKTGNSRSSNNSAPSSSASSSSSSSPSVGYLNNNNLPLPLTGAPRLNFLQQTVRPRENSSPLNLDLRISNISTNSYPYSLVPTPPQPLQQPQWSLRNQQTPIFRPNNNYPAIPMSSIPRLPIYNQAIYMQINPQQSAKVSPIPPNPGNLGNLPSPSLIDPSMRQYLVVLNDNTYSCYSCQQSRFKCLEDACTHISNTHVLPQLMIRSLPPPQNMTKKPTASVGPQQMKKNFQNPVLLDSRSIYGTNLPKPSNAQHSQPSQELQQLKTNYPNPLPSTNYNSMIVAHQNQSQFRYNDRSQLGSPHNIWSANTVLHNCEYCPNRTHFASTDELRVHIDTKHNFMCKICCHRFYHSKDLDVHNIEHELVWSANPYQRN